jgi:tetratricopeptide (TPR) repeat protein
MQKYQKPPTNYSQREFLIQELEKERIRKLEKSKKNKVYIENVPKVERRKSEAEKLTWFNDPHLLSEKITRLSEKKEITPQKISEKIIDLIERHTGSSNSVVIASAMSNLSKLKQFEQVLKLFEKYETRNMKVTEAAYTSLLQSLINVTDIVCSHEKKLNLAEKAYEKMEKSVVHLNIMLQFLASHKSEEATDLGIKIFQDQIAQVDHRSFSHIFKLLQYSSAMRSVVQPIVERNNFAMDENGNDVTGQFKQTKTLHTSPDQTIGLSTKAKKWAKLASELKYTSGDYAIELFKLAESKKMIDNMNLNEFIGIFGKVTNAHKIADQDRIYQKNLEYVKKIIGEYYGLPFTTMQTRLKPSPKYREINPKQFLNLLFLMNHIHMPKLAIHWHDILASKIEMDIPIKSTLLKMLEHAKMFPRALKLSQELNQNASDGLKLRVLNKSIKKDPKNRQKFFKEANQIYINEPKTWRVEYNMLLIFISMKKWVDALEFLKLHQEIFVKEFLPVGKKEKKFVYEYYELLFEKYQMKGFRLTGEDKKMLASIVELKKKAPVF